LHARYGSSPSLSRWWQAYHFANIALASDGC
jgi:hypothetical protein